MIINDRVTITTNPQTIVFPARRQMPSKSFRMFWVYYDGDYQTMGGQPVPNSKTVNGFIFSTTMVGGTLEIMAYYGVTGKAVFRRWVSWSQTDVHPFEEGGDDSTTPFSELTGV